MKELSLLLSSIVRSCKFLINASVGVNSYVHHSYIDAVAGEVRAEIAASSEMYAKYYWVSIILEPTIVSFDMASIGNRPVLSVSKCCRLTTLHGRLKSAPLRSPITSVRLHRLQNVPLLLAESAIGDLCIWNYETARALAVIDSREGATRSAK
jgi:hypothetical protein